MTIGVVGAADLRTTASGAKGKNDRLSPEDLGDVRYMARQPILDLRGNVHGYELLFRSSATSSGFSGDGEAATRSVLDHGIVLGAERLTGGLPMFVNCTERALVDRLVLVLPPKTTVLEVLEDIEPTPVLLAACRDLRSRGYRLALDDFTYSRKWEPMLELADYVKVDISTSTHSERKRLARWLEGRETQLVLERVETREELELGTSEGFTLFQGYYFCKPKLMSSKAIPANRMVFVEMLRTLLEDPLPVSRISDLVKRDASLTYRLLRMVNSPVYATRKEVRSIQGALVMLGDEMIRRVVTLAVACELSVGVPRELLQMAFARARFCELAAAMTGQDAMEQYLIGMLSLFPAILDLPMSSVSEAMPLRAEVRRALLGEDSVARMALTWLENYEQGLWEACDRIAALWGPAISGIPELYGDSVRWAETNLMLNPS